MKTAIHYGSGNIGRGFIAPLLIDSGFAVTFIDTNQVIIDAINDSKSYTVELLNSSHDQQIINGVTGLHSSQTADVLNHLSSADVITFSIGKDNLKFVVNDLVASIKLRITNNSTTSLNMIACENGIRVSSFLADLVAAELSAAENAYVKQYIGFVDVAVDRIVPEQHHADPLFVQVEPYFELALDAAQINGSLTIEQSKVVTNLDFYNKRKLLTVNTGHTICAILGREKGYRYISESIKSESIKA